MAFSVEDTKAEPKAEPKAKSKAHNWHTRSFAPATPPLSPIVDTPIVDSDSDSDSDNWGEWQGKAKQDLPKRDRDQDAETWSDDAYGSGKWDPDAVRRYNENQRWQGRSSTDQPAGDPAQRPPTPPSDEGDHPRARVRGARAARKPGEKRRGKPRPPKNNRFTTAAERRIGTAIATLGYSGSGASAASLYQIDEELSNFLAFGMLLLFVVLTFLTAYAVWSRCKQYLRNSAGWTQRLSDS